MQDAPNHYPEIIASLFGALVSWLGRWLFDRNKERKEVQKSEVELSEQVATLWRETSKELDSKIKEMRTEMDTILTEMDKLRIENRTLKDENGSLLQKVEKLTTRLQKFENTHGE